MISMLYLSFFVVCCLSSLTNWRHGVALAVVIDLVRDPARKLSTGEPVWITLSLLGLWVCIFAGAYLEDSKQLSRASYSLPGLRRGIEYCIWALIPGALVAVVTLPNGYLVAFAGAISYLAPFFGILLGIRYYQNENQIYRLFFLYVLLNSFALLTVVAEYFAIPLPALGGLQGVVWLRSFQNSQFLMPCGIYRAPDVMALHAAHVVIFSIILLVRQTKGVKVHWVVPAIWGILSLILGARRKMLVMPFVFVFSFLWIDNRSRSALIGRAFLPLSLAICAGVFFLASFDDDIVTTNYTDYAQTILVDGAERARDSLMSAALYSASEFGILGNGLGTATQGGRYFGAEQTWNEDGTSRLFVELGFIGVAVLVLAFSCLTKAVLAAKRLCIYNQKAHSLHCMLLALGIANASSYFISHQHFSGDPGAAVFALVLIGVALGISVKQAEFTKNPVHTSPQDDLRTRQPGTVPSFGLKPMNRV